MGGTWVTHHMAYLFKEMVRYKMDRDHILTHYRGHANDYYSINVPGTFHGIDYGWKFTNVRLLGATPRTLSHEEAGQITARAWEIFVDVDGEACRRTCPLPHAQLDNILVNRKDVEAWDKLSCAERFDQIKHLLTPEEAGILVALLLHISGGNMDNSSLWDMIRSHALMSYSVSNFAEVWTTFKLREGQSELAYRMFSDAVDNGLEYNFKMPVTSMTECTKDGQQLMDVKGQNGQVFSARYVVSTIPLNVLSTIKFSPPLSMRRQEAVQLGHVNYMTKIHAEIKGPGLTSWRGMRFPNNLMFGYGDGVLPNGNAHIVGFGKDERDTFVPEEHPEKVVEAFEKLHPMEVQKTVRHFCLCLSLL